MCDIMRLLIGCRRAKPSFHQEVPFYVLCICTLCVPHKYMNIRSTLRTKLSIQRELHRLAVSWVIFFFYLLAFKTICHMLF